MMERRQPESIPLRPSPHRQPAMRSDRNVHESFHNSPREEIGKAGMPEDSVLGYHRDFLGRNFTGYDLNEKFLNPYDGRLCFLVVQSSQDVQQSNPEATWYRTRVRNGSPWMIRISNWAMSRDHDSETPVGADIATAVRRWIPACLALALIVS